MARLRAIGVLLAILAFGVATVAGALALVDRMTARRDRLVIGSKAFTESLILAEISAQWLERNGVPVDRRFYLGATNISFEAIRSGAVDAYPEYTGTALMAILGRSAKTERDQVLPTIRSEFESRYGIAWITPFGFDNSYALAMPEALAARLHVEKISDLLAHTDLKAGFASEFLAREDGWPGMERAYDLHFRSAPVSMDAGLLYSAAASGELDVVSVYSTEGRIVTSHLRVLEDDRRFSPPYQAMLMARESALAHNPRARELLERLGGSIDETTMRRMNGEVDFGNRSVEDVARAFLDSSPKLAQ
jgi:glycine betaine/choline ABC-type transport system substrate-binding protein